MANLATKQGVEGKKLTIHTPLINLHKAQIIQKGLSLGVNCLYSFFNTTHLLFPASL
jgi:7-cyano-7-deazaguanine synthase in queuosine biosynthesis